MSADRIEREIDIDAPIEVVWDVITQPEHITGWFTDSAVIDVRPGAEGRFGWDEKATNRATFVNVQIERVEPPNVFAFRWNYPDGAGAGPATAPLVEFTLEPRGTGTHLLLVESGLQGIDQTDEEKDAYFADHTKGWDVIVPRLGDYVTAQRATLAGR